MKKYVLTLVVFLVAISSAAAQSPGSKTGASDSSPSTIPAPPPITSTSTPLELARAALAAQGGQKYKTLKSMMLVGTVQLYPPSSTQPVPGKFVIVTTGDKVRIDIDAPPVKFKQIFDGQQSYSSIPGVQLPPASKFGLAVLTKFDQPGYTVAAVPDKKKLRGFRITDSEGNATDFFIDSVTARVMLFVIQYQGYVFSTENSKFNEQEGVLIPVSFTQRLELGQGAGFAEYKVKEITLNQPIGDDVFVM